MDIVEKIDNILNEQKDIEFKIKEKDNDINMRLLILSIQKEFEPKKYKGKLYYQENSEKGELNIIIKDSKLANSIDSYLRKNSIKFE